MLTKTINKISKLNYYKSISYNKDIQTREVTEGNWPVSESATGGKPRGTAASPLIQQMTEDSKNKMNLENQEFFLA